MGKTFSLFQNCLYLSDFLLISLFFYLLFKKDKIKLFIKIFFILIIAFIVYLLSNNDLHKLLFQLYSVYNFGIFIFCLYYYYQLFNNNEPVLKLWDDPTFWIVAGLFLYAAISFPFFAIIDYLILNFGVAIARIALIFANIITIAEYLLFIKAFRCARGKINKATI
jgi:hypothetical protein